MKVMAKDLKVGQVIAIYGGTETVIDVLEFEMGVMVYFDSQKDNPFISSRFASWRLDHELEVIGYSA